MSHLTAGEEPSFLSSSPTVLGCSELVSYKFHLEQQGSSKNIKTSTEPLLSSWTNTAFEELEYLPLPPT